MARKDVTAVINIGRKAMREKEEIADVPMEGLPNPLMLENQLWKLKKKKKNTVSKVPPPGSDSAVLAKRLGHCVYIMLLQRTLVLCWV